MRQSASSVYKCQNPKGMKLLTRPYLDLIHIHYQKLNYISKTQETALEFFYKKSCFQYSQENTFLMKLQKGESKSVSQ